MRKTITAIGALSPQKKMIYVETISRKDDGNYQISTTFEPENAYDFKSRDNANRYIPKIFNPWNRDYKAMNLTVNRSTDYDQPDLS